MSNFPANAGTPWDVNQDIQLSELLAAGKNLAEIASEMKRTQAGIVARCERNAWKVPS